VDDRTLCKLEHSECQQNGTQRMTTSWPGKGKKEEELHVLDGKIADFQQLWPRTGRRKGGHCRRGGLVAEEVFEETWGEKKGVKG